VSAREGEHLARWRLFERCSRSGEVGEPYNNQKSTFAQALTSSSHSTTSPLSPIPYPHCVFQNSVRRLGSILFLAQDAQLATQSYTSAGMNSQ